MMFRLEILPLFVETQKTSFNLFYLLGIVLRSLRSTHWGRNEKKWDKTWRKWGRHIALIKMHQVQGEKQIIQTDSFLVDKSKHNKTKPKNREMEKEKRKKERETHSHRIKLQRNKIQQEDSKNPNFPLFTYKAYEWKTKLGRVRFCIK